MVGFDTSGVILRYDYSELIYINIYEYIFVVKNKLGYKKTALSFNLALLSQCVGEVDNNYLKYSIYNKRPGNGIVKGM